MKYHTTILMVIFSSLAIFNCDDDKSVNTHKNTFYDDIADITFLNNAFYTTNYDLSGNSGSQIDLLKFSEDDSNIFLADNYDLEMNGQGYFAITDDDTNLYLLVNEIINSG